MSLPTDTWEICEALIMERREDKSRDGWCYGLNRYVPSNSYAEVPLPNVMVFGSEAFGGWLGLAEVMRVGLP